MYGAFAECHHNGTPPFRAVVMDYPEDRKTHKLDDACLMGPSLLVAPLFGDAATRKLWLPGGDWFDFWTGAPFGGGREHEITADVDTIPVFVKSGALVPLADPVSHITPETVSQLEVRAYGPPPGTFSLPEDDGVTRAHEGGAFNTVTLRWPKRGRPVLERKGEFPLRRYAVREWRRMDTAK